MKRFIIYALLCPRCGCPRYVGQSSIGADRFKRHLLGMRSTDASHHKKQWVQSLLDAGLKPVFVELIELPSAEHINAAEVFWIAEMRRRGCPLTNLTDGGCGRTGHKDSLETIEKRRQKLLGRPVPQERRDRIAASLAGQPSPKKGRPLSPDELVKHAEARAIPPFQDQHGRVYKTIKEAAERWNLPPGNICNCLKGKRRSAGGLEFSYVDSELRPVRTERVLLTAEEKSAKNAARAKAWREARPEYSSTEAVRAWRAKQN
jgi:hypothetical protein